MAELVRVDARTARQLITVTFQNLAAQNGVEISPAALKEIRRIPIRYRLLGLFAVDPDELARALNAILLAAIHPDQHWVSAEDIRLAKRSIECHYLWFC